MLINQDAITGQPDRRRLRTQHQGQDSRGLYVPALGEGLISSSRDCFKDWRGRQGQTCGSRWAALRDFESRSGLLVLTIKMSEFHLQQDSAFHWYLFNYCNIPLR